MYYFIHAHSFKHARSHSNLLTHKCNYFHTFLLFPFYICSVAILNPYVSLLRCTRRFCSCLRSMTRQPRLSTSALAMCTSLWRAHSPRRSNWWKRCLRRRMIREDDGKFLYQENMDGWFFLEHLPKAINDHKRAC